MSSKGKGKEVATYGKRKQSAGDDKREKRNRSGVLQFFEDAADVQSSDDSEKSDFDEDDFMEEEPELNLKSGNGKSQNIPFVPKEEVIEEEEFDRMMEERYRSGAGFVRYADDPSEAKGSIDKDSLMSSNKGSTLWKVKCGVGRERHSVFCLMQKFVDLQALGDKLQIISAFSVDHVKGFIFIEADKECDIGEACKGLSAIYYSRVMPVPENEVSHLLSVRTTSSDVSAGMWARVKNGKYKGDLAQVVAVNSARKRATVKLIPRIDIQALAGKFGGGAPIKKAATPAPRLISSSELEEFRPLIQYRCDRDTGKRFEVLDGLMLKDGFLYKKVSIDSLSFWGIMPQEEELLRFKNSETSESVDTEWLSQLYGDRKSRRATKNDKGGGKGESSNSSAEDSFELYNLVCFGWKDFGLIVGKEKDDYYKILKEGSEGSVVVTVERRELKSGPLDAKFSALDRHKKLISINDTVQVLEGPSKDKQGMVKQIYRGTVFLYDENETENGGYFCCRSQMCEKIKFFADPLCGKDDEPGPFEFGGFPSSPKSPLVEEKPWEARESRNDFNRDKDGLFSIGQTLRIRVGPLKGYLCRVLAVRRADVTVKLDSQQKVLTVKNEHLCEVNRKKAVESSGVGASSFKPFDLLGSEGCSGGWGDGARTSTENNGWNTGGLSAEGNSWPSFTSSGVKPEEESDSLSKSSWDTAPKKDDENSVWGQQSDHPSKSSWDTAPKKDDENNGCGQQSNQTSKSSWDTAPKKDDETNAWGQQSDHPSKSSWDTAPKKDVETNAWGQQSNQTSKSSWDPAPKKDDETNALGQQSNQTNDDNNAWGQQPRHPNDGNNAWGHESNQPSKSSWDTAPKKDDISNAWGCKLPQGENPSSGEKAVEQGSEAATAKRDQDSVWGKKTSASQDSNWGNKGNSDSGFGDANKSKWSSAAADTKQESGWGGKESWKSGSTSASQDSGWGNKSNSQSGSGDANKSNWNSAAVDTNLESGWSAKGYRKSGSISANQGSCWGSSSNCQSGSGEANKNSTWSSGGKWNSGDSSDDISGAKNSNWNTGAGDSDWGSQGGWKQRSTSASQDSGWGNKGNWQSGSGDANKNSTWSNNGKWNSGDGNEDQYETFGNRGNGGNWRGRGRGDCGVFRGRGRSDRGGFGGRDRNDTEGFGGRGGDRGGFRGRGERGRFGGRGRGRRDDWNGNNESADVKSFSWGKETNNDQGWKRDDSGVKWNPESTSSGSWKGLNSGSDGTKQAGGWNNQGSSGKDADSTAGGWKSSSWNRSASEKETTDGNGQGGGWNKGSCGGSDTGGWNDADRKPTNGAAGSWGKSGDGGQSSGGSWKGWDSSSNGTKQAGGCNNQGSSGKDADTSGSWKSSSWNQSANEKQTTDGNGQEGGWNKEGSGWKRSSSYGVTNNGQSKSWNQTNAADGGQSSAWEQKKDANADGKPTLSWGDGVVSGDGGQLSAWNQSKATKEDLNASWGKPEPSSWGKPSDGGQASAWNQSKDAKEDPNAAWGKPDWGEGSDGSSKGGW